MASVKDYVVRVNMALERAELQEGRSVCLVLVAVDIGEATDGISQRGHRKNKIVERLFFVFKSLQEIQ